MVVLDANILLGAAAPNKDQERMRNWLDLALTRPELIGLPWVTIWAFIRIGTNRQIWREALTPDAARNYLEEILSLPQVRQIEPGPRHLEIVVRLMKEGQVAGRGATDAVIAALAVEHGATLVSVDQGFGRFPGLKWLNPLRG